MKYTYGRVSLCHHNSSHRPDLPHPFLFSSPLFDANAATGLVQPKHRWFRLKGVSSRSMKSPLLQRLTDAGLVRNQNITFTRQNIWMKACAVVNRVGVVVATFA